MVKSRILLKLSGESLLGNRDHGIDPDASSQVAIELVEVVKQGYQLAVVIGGGNIFRGLAASKNGLDRATADYIGMLATIMNSLALSQALEELGVDTRVMSSLVSAEVAEPYVRNKAMAHLDMGRLILLAGGTGNPYFTTDTAAVLRALELKCDLVLKGTKVDGVYDGDPKIVENTKVFDELTFNEALNRNLKVMDATAFAMCRDNNLPIVVFDFFRKGNLLRLLEGEKLGTLIKN